MILKVELDKKEIAKSLVHKPDMLFHDGELAEVDVTVTHNIKGIEDVIDALNSVADAVKSTEEKPFSFEKLKKVIDTFHEKVERYERQKPDEKKPGSFSEFLDEKKSQEDAEHQPKVDSFPTTDITLHNIPFWFEQGLSQFASLTQYQQFHIIGAICNFAMMNKEQQE